MKKVLVIGGGPAGMISAVKAAQDGDEVILFEKNDKLGRKLFITGKGRCNLTNVVPVENLLDNIPGNPYFLYSAFYSLDSYGTLEFFDKLGLKTKIERGNRAFPVSDKSRDVVKTLEVALEANRVKVYLDTTIAEIKYDKKRAVGVRTVDGRVFAGDKVIIATGGLSYPLTGSTGDGYKFARACGHKVTKLYPSLVGLLASEPWVSQLQGLSLKNVGVSICVNGKTVHKDFGEMLFTHNGVSGPVILSASRHLLGKFNQNSTISIDLKPALMDNELDTRILKDFDKNINRDFANSLDELLPQKLIPIIVKLSEIAPDKKVHDITKAERKNLVKLFKNFVVTIKDSAGFDEAVITSGGISVDEIDPSTMGSKIIKGLYFAGEVIDVDGYTGGFNLQIAFSTGHLAGTSTK